ncbi:MAG: 5-guanidino-2-oxopentanoate decarboxylase [Proteobacteria bacterium]|nr:5-guanidino-2-oxopentanoate decarboxylase [Pseudomonadota bacterium]MBI3498056.1 5-guanidino-2-oxopentanoate decarboxylase [Pseudomonadota bacterium]
MNDTVTKTSAGVAAIRLLEAYGVDLVFGIPGVHTLELYRGLANSRIRHVTPRHEQGGGFMADGYARVSGRPGVCILTTGPGVTNAATPIAQAYSDSMPMLIISSVNARADLGMGRGRLHEITNQQAAIAPLVAFSQTILEPAQLPDAMARAFAVFQGQRPRPVHIEIPIDVLELPAEFPIAARRAFGHPAPTADAIAAAAAILAQAKKPVMIVGGGAVNATAEVAAMAERLAAPVIATKAGKGTLADTHPLALGGNLISKPAQELLGSADVVLAVGTELAETDHYTAGLPIRGRLIRIDVDAKVLTRDYPAEVAILADAKLGLAALLAALGSDAVAALRGNSAKAEVARIRERILAAAPPLRLKHFKVLDALRRAMPETGVVFSDMTQIAYTGNTYYPCPRPRSWFHPNGYGTLGFALPAAIGAKLARPDRPTAVLVGDGGLLFTVQELATAVEESLPLAVVMWNNDGYGQIRDGLVARGVPEIGVNLRNPDHLALARAFGCRAVRPESLEAFTDSVREALTHEVPTLIEVHEQAGYLD